MSGYRIETAGRVNRAAPLKFTFDGVGYSGFEGDTLVSALLANGVDVLGRSFKYHRPRGAWGAWFDDPNAVFSARLNGVEMPNMIGATTPLEDGMELRAVNAFPSAKSDIKGALDLFNRFLGAGFYYKTFMWPDWHLFEHPIRKMAGLGALDGKVIEDFESDQIHDSCDLLVVGGGVSGLTAARTAAETGQNVVLVDDYAELGGTAFQRQLIDGVAAADWVGQQIAAITAACGRVMTNATAFGVFDHKLVGIVQNKGFGRAPDLTRMRAKRMVIASGVIDRPLTFGNNDRPGVMSLNGAAELVARYGVVAGKKIAILSSHSEVDHYASVLRDAGGDVEVIEARSTNIQALGKKRVTGLKLDGRRVACDTILTSAGLAPVLHLWRHAGGKLDWSETANAFLPAAGPDWISVTGSANGIFGVEAKLADARAVVSGSDRQARTASYKAFPVTPDPDSKLRQWVDFQHDVTVKDIALAKRENYVSVEHLKRYTTLGMANDQGKTSNVPALSLMAKLQDKPVPEVGTTTFRPPFVPVPLEIYRGAHRQQQFHPVKRLSLEAQHRAAGAALGEYGGWLRPAWYGDKEADTVKVEAKRARETAGFFDASPLGKIEVMGPDAEAFMNFIYYNNMATLKPGFIRYGFVLTERGAVFDDGVVARFDQNRYVISCSSSHVEGMSGLLEAWRQDGNDPDRVFIHDTTHHWSTVTVTGPKARDIVGAVVSGIDLSAEAFPHMQFRLGQMNGIEVRVARVSFTGDLSFEISIETGKVAQLWQAVSDAAKAHGAGPMGMEALAILRAEKGYIVVGKDTDGETMPHDLGFGAPRLKKKAAFVGDRSLHTENANREDRKLLTGLAVPAGETPLPEGAHIVSRQNGKMKSHGFVTSSYDSPNTGAPIAMALIDATLVKDSAKVEIFHLGASRQATIASPVFYDQQGDRLNA
jgi:sarcosine oxidase subunit alpha